MLNSRESVKVARANVDVQASRQTKAQRDRQRDQNLFTGDQAKLRNSYTHKGRGKPVGSLVRQFARCRG